MFTFLHYALAQLYRNKTKYCHQIQQLPMPWVEANDNIEVCNEGAGVNEILKSIFFCFCLFSSDDAGNDPKLEEVANGASFIFSLEDGTNIKAVSCRLIYLIWF